MIITINTDDLAVSLYENLKDYKKTVINEVLNGVSVDNFIVNEVYECEAGDIRINFLHEPLDVHDFHYALYDL